MTWTKEDYLVALKRDLDELKFTSQFILYDNAGVSGQKVNKEINKLRKKIDEGNTDCLFVDGYEEDYE